MSGADRPMNRQQRWQALSAVRYAVKGWAFGPASWLPGKIAQAEAIAAALPAELHDEADGLIQPLRDAVRT